MTSHYTTLNGYVTVTRQLIEPRCNIDLPQTEGYTPFFITTGQGHVSVTKQLIEARCNIDLQQREGYTSLFITAFQGCVSVTTQFLERRRMGPLPFYIKADLTVLVSKLGKSGGHVSVTKKLIEDSINCLVTDNVTKINVTSIFGVHPFFS